MAHFKDLWLMDCAMDPLQDQVSRSTLYRVWRECWERYLVLRNSCQGQHCTNCARFDEERAQAVAVLANTCITSNRSWQTVMLLSAATAWQRSTPRTRPLGREARRKPYLGRRRPGPEYHHLWHVPGQVLMPNNIGIQC